MSSNTNEQPRYWTTDEVAERYRTSPGSVRYWRHVGRGPRSIRIGRKVLYLEKDLDAFDALLLSEADGEMERKRHR